MSYWKAQPGGEPVRAFLFPTEDVGDSNLEPQQVRVKPNSRAYVHIDTTDFIPNGQASFIANQAGSIATEGVTKIGVSSIIFRYGGPNINPRNNKFIFTTDNSNSFTATIIEGYFLTIPAAIAALVSALNGAGSGLTFTAIQVPNTLLGLISASAPFRFTGGVGITNGQFLFGIPVTNVLSSTLGFGNIYLFYTRYIDVSSYSITQFTKLRAGATNNFRPDNVCRVYLTTDDVTGKFINKTFYTPIQWFAFNPSYNLQTVDITFYDEFSQPLYIPSYIHTVSSDLVLLAQR